MCVEVEEIYGNKLFDIVLIVDKVQGGFNCDDGVSVWKVYEGVWIEMEEVVKNYKKIVQNICDLVVNFFGCWCEVYEFWI